MLRFALAALLLVAACSHGVRYALLGTRAHPTTEGEALLTDRDGGGYQIEVHIDSLPAFARFGESYHAYVVWAGAPGEGSPRQLGALTVSEDGRSGALTAPVDRNGLELWVTVEESTDATLPSGNVLVHTELVAE